MMYATIYIRLHLCVHVCGWEVNGSHLTTSQNLMHFRWSELEATWEVPLVVPAIKEVVPRTEKYFKGCVSVKLWTFKLQILSLIHI